MENKQHPTIDEFRARFHYDPDTGLLSNKNNGHVYSPSCTGYVHFGWRGRHYRGHRIAWLLTHGRWPVEYIDHINGDPGDNRLCNLREATNQQNLQNRSMHKRNKLGVKGVILTDAGTYRAQLWHDNKFVLNKRFKTLGEARHAYQAKCVEVFGEWARPS